MSCHQASLSGSGSTKAPVHVHVHLDRGRVAHLTLPADAREPRCAQTHGSRGVIVLDHGPRRAEGKLVVINGRIVAPATCAVVPPVKRMGLPR